MSDISSAGLRGAVDLSSLVSKNAGSVPDSKWILQAGDNNFESVSRLSMQVPVVFEFVGAGVGSALGTVVDSYAGRIVLAIVDAGNNPGLTQAFQVREIPTVSALIAGRPMNLFVGLPSEIEIKQVFDELIRLAEENGVSGKISGAEKTPAEEPPPLPPLHQEAYSAIERADYPAAIAAYRKALAENPRDALAVAGLAQVLLLERLTGYQEVELRARAAEDPGNVDTAMAVADLDVNGGHLEDAFNRLLNLFALSESAERDQIRTRLLEFFEIAGNEDPRVPPARRKLATLLY